VAAALNRTVADTDELHVCNIVQVSESDEAALMKRVKALWRARMLAPPSQDKLGELLAEVRNEQKVNILRCTEKSQ
jgi:hypothetical protein